MAVLAARSFCRGLLNSRRVILHSSIPRSQTKNLWLQTIFRASLNINKFRFYSQDSNEWVTITFERDDGTQLKRKAKVGSTIQEIIGQANPDFPGYGACDGTISCSTCQVILTKEDYERLGQPTDDEDDTLDLSPGLAETSRLGCCVTVESWMDGIVLKLPAEVKDLRETPSTS